MELPPIPNNAKAGKKRGKSPGDMPRRPLSAYNLFFRDERPRIMAKFELGEAQDDFDMGTGGMAQSDQAQQPGESKKYHSELFQKVARTIARRWKALKGPERKKYEDMAKEEMKEYRHKIQEYKKKFLESTMRAARQSSTPSFPMPARLPAATETGPLPNQSFSVNQMNSAGSSPSLRMGGPSSYTGNSLGPPRVASLPAMLPPLDVSGQRNHQWYNTTAPTVSRRSTLYATLPSPASVASVYNNSSNTTTQQLPHPPFNSSSFTALSSMPFFEASNFGAFTMPSSPQSAGDRLRLLRLASLEGRGQLIHPSEVARARHDLHQQQQDLMLTERLVCEQHIRERRELLQRQQSQPSQLQMLQDIARLQRRRQPEPPQIWMGQPPPAAAAYEEEPHSPASSMSLREALRLYMQQRRR
uniref:HMG box domain-containing protein n=1 Tax=Amphora coffeiformis TaxID=265554 RepID=A0A7S3L4H6_9STRA